VEIRPGPKGGMLRVGGPGRPKGSLSLTALLKEKLAEGTNADELIQSTLEQAKAGNPAAMKILWDRMEGPMTTVSQVTVDDVSNLTESERVSRIAAIYDAATAARAGSVDSECEPGDLAQ